MDPRHLWLYGVFLFAVTLCVRPLGRYLTHVFNREPTLLDPLLLPLERRLYRLAGIHPQQEMSWQAYTGALIVAGLLGVAFVTLMLLLQPLGQPADPHYRPGPLSFLLALNTAISFATTTTWQAYSGESALSYLSQSLALTSQNFLAGGAGLAVGIAFIRGFSRRHCDTLGNFWVDLTRAVLWVLLPMSLVGGLLLVWQGVPQNWHAYIPLKTLAGAGQLLPQGPVASLEFIKNLGTNGGGFFAANGAHPYANPSGLSNLIGMLAIVLLPAALTYTFGQMTQRQAHGWVLYGVMVTLFCAGLGLHDRAEQAGNPRLAAQAIAQQESPWQSGGNMEGKETRFGIASTTLTAIVTSNTATGSINQSIDSDTPLGGGVLLINLLLGEVVFGGLGSGLYSLVLTALVAVFVTGLMIGRTPEYLGKTLGPQEVKLIALYTVIAPAVILPLGALALIAPAGLAGLATNQGAHNLTAVLIAYASCFANNGMSFGGMSVDSPFYHLTTMLAMLAGRFGLAAPILALAGCFARQGRRPQSAGTLPTDGWGFGGVILATLLLVVGLSFLPVWVMGPLVEHLQMLKGP
ncbi:potassium-transporting ATPase subunit KdpA [Paludibacterium sp.]|uniref:potassium-transporting ATPase subunit KdpA n=1 Tax=Paludibacterium sp. TaxID=1917523 RepID=UPI0025F81172|nr:potassium-transporting ATPase subunit KdpA [Paludibacterium sp.]MBV8648253.1 potassium-transporting ATPase subunit KdpA [Paludibacterium sp.]